MSNKDKLFSLFLPVLVLAMVATGAEAKVKNSPRKRKAAPSIQSQLGTDHSFNELSVRGRYQSAFEGVATVENEKELHDLLDYRTNYNDRIKGSRVQR
ncbi:MAG: hypothetical protein KDD38_05705 [Bdellovibrionales bacterium]|nr:hypothetical protein [Bdellovibrionales bacterium]